MKTNDWIKKAIEIHGTKYDYSKVEYISSKLPVIIICKIHGDFSQVAGTHVIGKGCSKCSGNYRYTTEEWIEKAIKIHGTKYDYSKVEYKNSITNIIIICKEHGEFLQNPRNHVDKKQNCSKCMNNYNYNTEDWIEKAIKIHGYKYDYSKVNYISNNTYITIICKEHGEFLQTSCAHLNSKAGCAKCAGKYNYSTEEWVERAIKICGNKYDYSKVDYRNTNTNIIIICKEHGEFLQNPHNHISQKQDCPTCILNNFNHGTSKSENMAKKIIEKYTGKIFIKVRPIFLNRLELDGYNEELKMAFEYQGVQHEEFTPFYHTSINKFNIQQERDRRKMRLCIKNNIKLLVIPSKYTFKNPNKMTEFIINFFKNNSI